jgi:N-acetylglutamate synthase-like GNAT family acetyltransferase
MMTIHPAEGSADLSFAVIDALRLPLVNRFYQHCRYSAKAVRNEHVCVVRRQQQIVAAVRLTPQADGSLFLRSMCVDPALRGQGIGRYLLAQLQPLLDTAFCYCFPFSHLPDFYASAGFIVAADTDVAPAVAEACQRYRRQGRAIVIMVRDGMARGGAHV